ncbi:MBL fold metallo-hydrolase [Haliangium ochraceum]|uniref:Beta-lactamase domain protein n=1 Tax=Haliangium ochraceum (strain DSM 14365 / JCM 11303 / SMP-2) TaxID=502025 RepID=D0LL05_HALO1|nr:MBL fold metallo-hydrolase [Haliangium ochraceum]ACY16725.1 beta-lactamase domain protein [Haliangium ochraceum DSM 14365]
MRVAFWGVRGSIPTPGPETNRYGGNTSCVEVRTKSDELIIIDMGTGAVPLGKRLMAGAFGKGQGRATLLLSHSHWDHIQGFPFFAPVFVPGNELTMYGNAKSPSMLEGILEGQMNPHFSPLYTIKNLGASIDFRTVVQGESFALGEVQMRAQPNPHGGTTALAFRLEEDGKSFVYASDVGYSDDASMAAAVAFYRGADVLLHDCTYSPEDQTTRRNRGFSSYVEAARVAVEAKVGHLVMFHYDQDYSDEIVDELAKACRRELDTRGGRDIELSAAAEGSVVEL